MGGGKGPSEAAFPAVPCRAAMLEGNLGVASLEILLGVGQMLLKVIQQSRRGVAPEVGHWSLLDIALEILDGDMDSRDVGRS